MWLTFSGSRSLSYRNQSTDKDPRHERFKESYEHLKFSQKFRQYEISKNNLFRLSIDVSTTLLHGHRFTDVLKAS